MRAQRSAWSPTNPDNFLVLGDIRESIRIGAPFERN